MTSRIVLTVVVFLLVLCLVWLAVSAGDNPTDITQPVRIDVPWVEAVYTPPTTTTTARARSAPTVRSRSVATPVIAESSIRGFPCGGDLPPCWVLKRESMMATDPARVWNGNCYMPAGSYGQCGRSTASGLWQALRSTWKGYGGYVNAADAPVDVQNDFARRLWAGGRGCGHWSAC